MNPSPIDLTSVQAVKNWLSGTGKASEADQDDDNIQLCITACGMYWLTRTGRGSQDGGIPTASPFNQPVTFNETYNGNGKESLFLRNSPIQSVSSLVVNGTTIPQSTAWNQTGWVIQADGKRISIRSGGGSNTRLVTEYVLGRLVFNRGIQNVEVTYDAGYAMIPVVNELQTVPSTGPYTVTVDDQWLADIGVKYFSTGDPLEQVQTSPNEGQYYVQSPGVYLFNEADESQQLQFSYNTPGTPPDVALAAVQQVAVNYKRKKWIDQRSQSMAHGAGTISFRDWELPPEVVRVLVNYTRTSMP